MFEGKLGKQMMIDQGYVPAGCKLPVELAGPLIYSTVKDGGSPCDGCVHDRKDCAPLHASRSRSDQREQGEG